MSAFRLDDRVALIVGVRAGIGESIANCLADAGADVVLANRTLECAEQVATKLRARGQRAQAIRYSADESGAKHAVASALAFCGRLDILINNAGGCSWQALEEIDSQSLEQALSLNLKSCFWLAQAALPALKRSAAGRIIVTSSITGPRVAMIRAAHYAAAKAGVNGFIKSAALELAPFRITVNGVEPGLIAKGRGRLSEKTTLERIERYIPLRRAGGPEDIGYAMLYFASAEASWVTGQTLIVDGGMTLPESGYAMEEQWSGLSQRGPA